MAIEGRVDAVPEACFQREQLAAGARDGPGAWISSDGQPITTIEPASSARSSASAAAAATTEPAIGPWPHECVGRIEPSSVTAGTAS